MKDLYEILYGLHMTTDKHKLKQDTLCDIIRKTFESFWPQSSSQLHRSDENGIKLKRILQIHKVLFCVKKVRNINLLSTVSHVSWTTLLRIDSKASKVLDLK